MRASLFVGVGIAMLVAASQSFPVLAEPFCPEDLPRAWREAQVIEGVEIQEERACWPDNPYEVAAFVKGMNNLSVPTLAKIPLAADAVLKENDRDGDGDPDEITIKLEIAELNGPAAEKTQSLEFSIAPKVSPVFWVFSPKMRLSAAQEEWPRVRFPSPVIRVEAGDRVRLVLENTHYLPHALRLFGVDHPAAEEGWVAPGQVLELEFTPRQPGTMVYQAVDAADVGLGLIGMFVVEENRPNNWVQTFNLGAGKVRHPAKGVLESYDQEYDLHYQAPDQGLQQAVQLAKDPEQVAKALAEYAGKSPAYPLLNGRRFPYSLRESPIVVRPNQTIKLRLLNAHSDPVALAFYGHRATITHYDGIEHHPLAQVMRDVFDLAPGQRLDLRLVTADDGLHAFGPGVWKIAGRFLQGVGWQDLGAIVYEAFLDAEDVPKLDSKRFFATVETKKRPEGKKGLKKIEDLLIGMVLGLLAYVLFSNQHRARELVRRYLARK
jgi:hypothetical protein